MGTRDIYDKPEAMRDKQKVNDGLVIDESFIFVLRNFIWESSNK
jgi:hypothetical protein